MKAALFFILLATFLLIPDASGADLRVPADHATIQAAIDKASAGDRILVAPGIYKERVTLKPRLTLMSDGDQTPGKLGLRRAEATIIDGGGDGKSPGVTMAEDAVIDGFTVRNVGRYDEALWQKHWEERGENQDRIGGFSLPGIGADGVSCRITNCLVHHNGHTGIAIRGKKNSPVHVLVTDNVTFRNMGGGIGIMGGSSGIIRSNRCFENFHAGIGHSDHAIPLVIGNECYNNVRAGIGVSERSSPVVRQNNCHHNRRAGIGIRTGAETRPIIEDNHCHHNGMAGIGSKEQAEPIIRNNRCEENAMAGIGAQLDARPIIVDNRCVRNAQAGIGLRAGCKGIIWNNHCIDNKLVAIGLPQNGRAIIADNKLTRAGGMPPLVAIRGGSEAILSGNALKGGGVAGVLVEGQAILHGNEIKGANEKFGQGIWLWKGSQAMIQGNRIDGFKQSVTVSEGASLIKDER
ncbi:MAG: right-handed parallel beta-helix repeat-containing protein [Akkermansiaceae bacterium]